MNARLISRISAITLAAGALIGLGVPAQAAPDAEAAQAVLKKNDCGKCHSLDKDKKGPSLKKIAAKYKGKPDGEEKTIKNMTTGLKVKLDDGTEEEHKVIKLDPKKADEMAQIKNIAEYILTR